MASPGFPKLFLPGRMGNWIMALLRTRSGHPWDNPNSTVQNITPKKTPKKIKLDLNCTRHSSLEWKVGTGRIWQHCNTEPQVLFTAPLFTKGFTADSGNVSQHSRAYACMIRPQLLWFRIPFFLCEMLVPGLLDSHKRSSDICLCTRKAAAEEFSSKYTLRGANTGLLPRLWWIHIIGAVFATHKSSELLRNAASPFLSSDFILALQSHRQDVIILSPSSLWLTAVTLLSVMGRGA